MPTPHHHQPFQVIGYHKGADGCVGVDLRTSCAIEVGVVAEKPGLVGNMPIGLPDPASVPVVFAGWPGRVEALVAGPIKIGDKLSPSGLNDGTAVAADEHDGKPTLGMVERLLDESDTTDPRPVLVLMGSNASVSVSDGWDLCSNVSSERLSQVSVDVASLKEMQQMREMMKSLVKENQARADSRRCPRAHICTARLRDACCLSACHCAPRAEAVQPARHHDRAQPVP